MPVNEPGYRGTSINRILARLHVTRGSFHQDNETKHNLSSACFKSRSAVVSHTPRAAALVRFHFGLLGAARPGLTRPVHRPDGRCGTPAA